MRWRMIYEFLKEPSKVGAICPSSRGLAEAMTLNIDLEKAISVVEIGPGSGAITTSIQAQISSEAKFIMVEPNRHFRKALKRKFPDARIYNEGAESLGKILAIEGMKTVDVVLSSLPWSLFDLEQQCHILDEIVAAIGDDGRFATYAYLHGSLLPGGGRFKMELLKRFGSVQTSRIVWKNFPPAFIYRCYSARK